MSLENLTLTTYPSIGPKLSLIGQKCFGLNQNVFDMAQKAKCRSEN